MLSWVLRSLTSVSRRQQFACRSFGNRRCHRAICRKAIFLRDLYAQWVFRLVLSSEDSCKNYNRGFNGTDWLA